MSNLLNKLRNFISDNIELISEYESMENAIPVDSCSTDIVRGFQVLSKINKCIDFNIVLKEILTNAIYKNINISDSLEDIISKYSTQTNDVNITQQYFREINNIYVKHKNDYNIEYCEENRNKLIEMNLKTVVMIAKKYQGLGLTLNELISAGNLGLVIAYDKFDPTRSKLKDDILLKIKELPDKFDFKTLHDNVQEFLKYGDIKKKFLERFQKDTTYTKRELLRWINANIYNAKFNSVATMWIRAYILIELDNNSRLVKKPKSEIYKDREEFGSYKKETTLDIDSPVSTESNTPLSNVMKLEDDSVMDIDVNESYNILKSGLNKLLEGVKVRDRGIFLKKFGIGLPRPLLPKEIAEQEGLSIARISQIFQTVIEQMQCNQVKYNINPDILFDAAKKIQ